MVAFSPRTCSLLSWSLSTPYFRNEYLVLGSFDDIKSTRFCLSMETTLLFIAIQNHVVNSFLKVRSGLFDWEIFNYLIHRRVCWSLQVLVRSHNWTFFLILRHFYWMNPALRFCSLKDRLILIKGCWSIGSYSFHSLINDLFLFSHLLF